jgi:hypothetical protein
MHGVIRVRQLGLIYLLFLILSFFAIKPGLLILDGLAYYSYLPSLFLDGDLNFWNEFRFGGVFNQNGSQTRGITPAGYVSNHWSVGPAVLWWPFWAGGHVLTAILKYFGQPWALNGFSFYYNVGVRFATAIFGLSAILITFSWLQRFFSARSVMLALFLIVFGTPFFWYTYTNADMSHVPAAFAVALYLFVWQKRNESAPGILLDIAIGLTGGLVSLIRLQDGLIFIFLLPIWIREAKSGISSKLTFAKEIGWIAAGAAFVLLLQICVWQIVWGNPLGSIFQVTPFGHSNFYYIFGAHSYPFEIFFSSYHGIFFFAPILLFSFIGLFCALRLQKTRAIGACSILILFFQLFLMSHERWFWEGTSFGMRRLVDWTPFYILGLTVLFDMVERLWVRVACIGAALWTVLLNLTYVARPMSVLFDYQPPSVIFDWMMQILTELPKNIGHVLTPASPPGILLIALIFFAPAGFLVTLGIVRFVESMQNDKSKNIVVGFSIIAVLIGTVYAMVFRAASNGEESKAKYATELNWLKEKSESGYRQGIAEHIFSEGKFLALYKGWEPAKKSFQEAIQVSPKPDALRSRIVAFIRQHLPDREASEYLSRL